MYIRKTVYLPYKKTRREYYLIKIDAVAGFNITVLNNWVDVEKDSTTVRISIPVGEYTDPDLFIRSLRKSIRESSVLKTDISFSIDSLSNKLQATYSGTTSLIFKFSPTVTESLRQGLGFVGTANEFPFTQISPGKYELISPGSIPVFNGSLFSEPYSGPPVPEELDQPDNLPELFPFRGGNITQGIVRDIRKYTYDFITASFPSPPGADEDTPGGDFVATPYIIKEGSTQINFDKNNPQPASSITFTINQDIAIEKERPIKAPPTTSDFESVPSWTGDITAIRKRQSDHFQKSQAEGSTGRPQFEKYDAYGQVFFKVYGSRIRALEEVRAILYKPEKPRDILVGTYTKYFDNGRVWKIERYANPTYVESTSAKIDDSFLQGRYLEFYKNGRPRIEANFNNNFLNGAYREYYEDGLIRCQGILVNGKLNGEYTQWDEEGNRKFKAFYVNGTLDNSYVLDYSL